MSGMKVVGSSGTAVVSLPSGTQILITRVFAAPADRVFRAWTRPELIERWWAGRRGRVTSTTVDLRVGGRWRYVMETHSGFEVAFHGEYLEVAEGVRLVYTEVYEGRRDAPAVTTVTFEEADGRTTVTVLVQHETRAHRDAHIDSGMEGGLQEALDLLERVAMDIA